MSEGTYTGRTHVDLRALRTACGLSVNDCAKALEVNTKSWMRWEDPNGAGHDAPDAAWDYVLGRLEAHDRRVEAVLDDAAAQIAARGVPAIVTLDGNKFHDAASVEAAQRLRAQGYDVEFDAAR